jgi:hypothetical protein
MMGRQLTRFLDVQGAVRMVMMGRFLGVNRPVDPMLGAAFRESVVQYTQCLHK